MVPGLEFPFICDYLFDRYEVILPVLMPINGLDFVLFDAISPGVLCWVRSFLEFPRRIITITPQNFVAFYGKTDR